MPRTNYHNGEEIGLKDCGCDGCNILVINGVLCHETGCPYSYKDSTISCSECGCDFHPENRYQNTCNDCLNPDEDEYLFDDKDLLNLHEDEDEDEDEDDLLALLEELLSITEHLKPNMDSETFDSWQRISAKTADIRESQNEY